MYLDTTAIQLGAEEEQDLFQELAEVAGPAVGLGQAYHLVRTWHALPTLPYLGQQIAMIRDDPSLSHV